MYEGMQASVSTVIAKNSLSAGVYGYAQHENDLFAATFNDGSAASFSVNPVVTGGVEEVFVEDNYRPTNWLTLIAGERQTHFSGAISENAIYPRVGAAVVIPKLHWVFRGFYGHFYQPPPLTSITGPALAYAQTSNDSYVPLKGERDEEHQFGVQIPFRGWLLDADTFQTQAQNFLDHNNIGESSIFIPITVQGALIQGWELTLRSPHLWRYGQAHLSYSNQIAKQIGGITGGLTCYSPSDPTVCAVAAGVFAARPRSAEHAECRVQCEPAVWGVRVVQCVLRLGVLEWIPAGAFAVHGGVSAVAYDRGSGVGEDVWRECNGLGERVERRQYAGAAG